MIESNMPRSAHTSPPPVQRTANEHLDKLRCGGIKKHIVIKCDDAEKALSKKGTIRLMSVLDTIEEYREEIGKSIDNEYLVINTDEPYVGEIIEILRRNGHWG